MEEAKAARVAAKWQALLARKAKNDAKWEAKWVREHPDASEWDLADAKADRALALAKFRDEGYGRFTGKLKDRSKKSGRGRKDAMLEQELLDMPAYKPRKVVINVPQQVRRGRGAKPTINPVVEDLFERALQEQSEKEAEARAKLRALTKK